MRLPYQKPPYTTRTSVSAVEGFVVSMFRSEPAHQEQHAEVNKYGTNNHHNIYKRRDVTRVLATVQRAKVMIKGVKASDAIRKYEALYYLCSE